MAAIILTVLEIRKLTGIEIMHLSHRPLVINSQSGSRKEFFQYLISNAFRQQLQCF